MADANERLRDFVIKHQIDLLRYSRGVFRQLVPLLEKADAQLAQTLAQRLAASGLAERSHDSFSTLRLKQLLKTIRDMRQAAMLNLRTKMREEMLQLAQSEAEFEQQAIQRSVPVELQLASPAVQTLNAVVTTRPFQGAVMRDWFRRLERAEQGRLQDAIRQGVTQGETIDQMVRRVRGSKAQNFTDGILSTTRQQAEAIVRTSVNAVSNGARDAVWKENSDIISELRWHSTLDGRTTPVCRARDGTVYPVDSGPRPPAHFGCRSLMVAVIDGSKAVGERPFVIDTRTGKRRQLDFQKDARAKLRERLGRTPQPSEVRAEARVLKDDWAATHIGQAPASLTYGEWLKRQSAAFQDEVMGETKGALFRRGGLTVDKFVDETGHAYTLKELRARYPGAFQRANVE